MSYRTCLTEDRVPDNTEVFANSASLNGRPGHRFGEGPEFKSGKSGQLNTTERDVAGEKQTAGTTSTGRWRFPDVTSKA
ncbi:hypothetical protein GTA07_10535 [Rhodococcus hoagii]|nr:hypothetical protein [Prescottella equi]